MRNDFRLVKLGGRKAVYDPRTLNFQMFTTPQLPSPPPVVKYSGGVKEWGMMLNGPNTYGDGVPADGLGDCTIAAPAHADQVWTLNATGKMVTIPDSAVLLAYEQADGYHPGNPNTDNGGDLLTVAKYLRTHGLPGRPPIDAFVAVHQVMDGQMLQLDLTATRQAQWLFGGLSVGLQLPLAWQTDKVWHAGSPYDPNYQPGSWGPHNAWIVDYNSLGPVYITWGELIQGTWNGLLAYCDQALAFISKDQLRATGGFSFSGFQWDKLETFLQLVTA